MPSKSLTQLQERLKEVNQLLDAHSAMTKFKRAESEARRASGTLVGVADLIRNLVSPPRAGRPSEVQALNSSAIALLSAHFQGFVSDLFDETVDHVLTGKVKDPISVKDSPLKRGNPNTDNIENLFASIGFPNLLSGVFWAPWSSNVPMKAKLRRFNKLRNSIVHGKSERIIKNTVRDYLGFVEKLAGAIDKKLKTEITSVSGGRAPW